MELSFLPAKPTRQAVRPSTFRIEGTRSIASGTPSSRILPKESLSLLIFSTIGFLSVQDIKLLYRLLDSLALGGGLNGAVGVPHDDEEHRYASGAFQWHLRCRSQYQIWQSVRRAGINKRTL